MSQEALLEHVDELVRLGEELCAKNNQHQALGSQYYYWEALVLWLFQKHAPKDSPWARLEIVTDEQPNPGIVAAELIDARPEHLQGVLLAFRDELHRYLRQLPLLPAFHFRM
jgi:hypothetical protein